MFKKYLSSEWDEIPKSWIRKYIALWVLALIAMVGMVFMIYRRDLTFLWGIGALLSVGFILSVQLWNDIPEKFKPW